LVQNYEKSKKILRKKFKIKDLAEIGGLSLLTKYNGSPSSLITTVFPEYNLLPWKFTSRPLNFWEKVENRRKFFDWAAPQLGIKEYSDWYNVLAKVSL
jgi:hypothetical protein